MGIRLDADLSSVKALNAELEKTLSLQTTINQAGIRIQQGDPSKGGYRVPGTTQGIISRSSALRMPAGSPGGTGGQFASLQQITAAIGSDFNPMSKMGMQYVQSISGGSNMSYDQFVGAHNIISMNASAARQEDSSYNRMSRDLSWSYRQDDKEQAQQERVDRQNIKQGNALIDQHRRITNNYNRMNDQVMNGMGWGMRDSAVTGLGLPSTRTYTQGNTDPYEGLNFSRDPNYQMALPGGTIGADQGGYAQATNSSWLANQNIFPGLRSTRAFFPGFGKAMLYAGGQAMAEYYSLHANAELTGRTDPMGAMTLPYKAAGGFIGGAIGSVFGGYGGLVGAAVGQQAIGSLGEYLNAQRVRDIRFNSTAESFGTLINSASGGWQTDIRPSFLRNTWGVFGGSQTTGNSPVTNDGIGLVGSINQKFSSGESMIRNAYSKYFPDQATRDAMTPTKEELMQGGSGILSALFTGGEDPQQVVHGKRLTSTSRTNYKLYGALGKATNMDFSVIEEDMSLADQIYNNSYMRWLKDATPILQKNVLPILSESTRLGNNYGDIAMKFGYESTLRYAEARTNIGDPLPFDPKKLRQSLSSMQSSDRQLELDSYKARGSGESMYKTSSDMLNTIKDLPGGAPLEYGKMQMQQRQYQLTAYQEQDITSYGIPMTKLQGERQRANILPFGPGHIFGLDLQMLSMEKNQLGIKNQQLNSLRSRGMLSEEEELRRVSEIENLQTSSASHVAELSDGMLNRMPAFHTGRPSRFTSFDSYQLASLNLMKIGHPNRYYGAFNGQQSDMQDSFIRSFAVPGTGAPYSRSQGIDATLPVLQRIADTLDKISRNQQGSGSTRPGQENGRGAGGIQNHQAPQTKGTI